MTIQQAPGPTPPYGSFKSMKNFIGQLAKTVFPSHIDREMMKGMSGATQSETANALRFLGCVDQKGRTTPTLKKLVDSHGKDSWKSALKDALGGAYKPIIGDMTISNGSAKQLADSFRRTTGADGFMLARHVRFYLAALRDAGVEYSPHFRVPSTPPRKKKAGGGDSGNTKKVASDKKGGNGSTAPTPGGIVEFKIPLGGTDALIQVPRTITTSQFPVFKAFVDAVEALAKQNSETGKD